MPVLVTSAADANDEGYGTLLAFDLDGRPLGAFSGDSRFSDPRPCRGSRDEGLLFLNSGTDRVLALDPDGRVVRDSGPIEALNLGGGNFGPDGRYYLAPAARVRSTPGSKRWMSMVMADDENSDFVANDAEQEVIREPPQIRSPDITLPD